MAPRTKKAADAIDKRRPRRQHIILQTLPPLVFSTPNNTVTIRFAMSTSDVKLARPQSSQSRNTFGSGDGNAHVSWADVEDVKQNLQRSIQREGSSIRQDVKQQVDTLDAKIVTLDAKIDALDAKFIHKIDHILGSVLPKQFRSVDARFDDIEKHMAERSHDIETTMDERFEDMEKTMNDGFSQASKNFKQVADNFKTMEENFDAADERFDAVDKRFDTVDQRFDAVDQRFGVMDQRFDAMDRRFDALQNDIRSIMAMLQMQQGASTQSPPRIVAHPPSSHSHDAPSGHARSRYVSDASQSSAAGPSSPRHLSAEASDDDVSLSSSRREVGLKMFKKIRRMTSIGTSILSKKKGKGTAE